MKYTLNKLRMEGGRKLLYIHLKVNLLLDRLQMAFLLPQPDDGPYLNEVSGQTAGLQNHSSRTPQAFLWNC